MTNRTISVEVQCRNCGSTVFDIPDEASDDPIAKCVHCHNILGPISAIHAKIRGGSHTPVNVDIVTKIIDR